MDELLSLAVKHRRALHQIPEVGYDLPRTQAYVIEALKDTGAEIKTVSPAGVLAYYDFGKGETLALRSDMDALPIEELGECEFRSRHAGAMHACGHDAHMGMLLTVATQIRNLHPRRNVLLIFQPAEESGNGAGAMIRAGALENYNVREIFACHVEPCLPCGAIASKSGEYMPLTSEVHVTVTGKSTHIAKANEGIDAVRAGARFLLESTDLIHEKYAGIPHLYEYGRLEGGTANNIIAGKCTIHGALRAFSTENFDRMLGDIERCAEQIASQTGASFDFDVPRGYPSLINDAVSYDKLRSLTGSLPFIELKKPWMIAEDFACYLQKVPGLMFHLGVESPTPLHSQYFEMNESGLINGIRMFLALITEKPA